MGWPDKALPGYVHGMNHSCSSLLTACLGLEACNSWLVPVIQACSATASPACDQRSLSSQRSQCGLRVQQFYEGLPQTTAEMLAFCSCPEEDQACEMARESLKGGGGGGGTSCEADQDWTCLEMLDTCRESRMCRERFDRLLWKCLGIGPASYHGETHFDWVHLSDLDLILSEDRECRMAMVSTMGTTLQHSCTCDGLYSYQHHKCRMLHRLLHDHSMFMTNVAVSGAAVQSADTDQWIHREWWLNDDFLYIGVYVVLVVALLGVVLIVLHKLGMRKRVADQVRYDTPLQKNSGTPFG
ncbi:GDNF family receptor alpha-like [Engraulis encrasicolus]|uniref:GDNF family receptor alpha-like n=1 Tax=Engraulis encrasicolus TaxID=184585 RepID=UPI002FD0BBFE